MSWPEKEIEKHCIYRGTVSICDRKFQFVKELRAQFYQIANENHLRHLFYKYQPEKLDIKGTLPVQKVVKWLQNRVASTQCIPVVFEIETRDEEGRTQFAEFLKDRKSNCAAIIEAKDKMKIYIFERQCSQPILEVLHQRRDIPSTLTPITDLWGMAILGNLKIQKLSTPSTKQIRMEEVQLAKLLPLKPQLKEALEFFCQHDETSNWIPPAPPSQSRRKKHSREQEYMTMHRINQKKYAKRHEEFLKPPAKRKKSNEHYETEEVTSTNAATRDQFYANSSRSETLYDTRKTRSTYSPPPSSSAHTKPVSTRKTYSPPPVTQTTQAPRNTGYSPPPPSTAQYVPNRSRRHRTSGYSPKTSRNYSPPSKRDSDRYATTNSWANSTGYSPPQKSNYRGSYADGYSRREDDAYRDRDRYRRREGKRHHQPMNYNDFHVAGASSKYDQYEYDKSHKKRKPNYY